MFVITLISMSSSSPLRRQCHRGYFFVMKWASLNWLLGQKCLLAAAAAFASKTAATNTRHSTPFFEEGRVSIPRGEDKYSLYYRIYKDNDKDPSLSIDRNRAAPLVVLHGGPSLPSQYLYPLVDHLKASSPPPTSTTLSKRRTVLFYDQLGCGKSAEPKDSTLYSIEKSVDDLQTLLQQALFAAAGQQQNDDSSSSSIHLLGHSYGGVLAYEYVKRLVLQQCHDENDEENMKINVKSLILSNTPTSMALAGSEYDRLYAKNPATFWNEHVCRIRQYLPIVRQTPPALKNALANVGTVWSGMNVVLDWEATRVTTKDVDAMKVQQQFPPTLIIGGKYDFGAKASEGWKDLIPHAEMITLENCAHYPHLEDGPTFGRLVEIFCQCQEGV